VLNINLQHECGSMYFHPFIYYNLNSISLTAKFISVHVVATTDDDGKQNSLI